MKLFAIYIGGAMTGANIEVHDMRFIIAESIEETYPALRHQWWGSPRSLHIDCWSELTRADGYAIHLKNEPSTDSLKLFYVNLGGYDSLQFTEIHKNMFVVAESESKAKTRALRTVRHWDAFHKDDLFEAEQCFCIATAASDPAWFIHLEKIADASPALFTCYYKRLG